MTPAALLLDLDGTLVDSEPRHVRSHQLFLAGENVAISAEECIGNIGKGDRAFYARIIAERALQGDPDAWVARKTELLMRSYREQGLALRPGAQELLESAFRLGIPCVVVTSAVRELCRLSLEVTGLAHRLMARVCHEDVRSHKPDPEPYLLAAARLGVPPGRCLVVEDSLAGVASGCAAGCTVIGFGGMVPAAALQSAGAHRTVTSLADVLPGTARRAARAGHGAA